MRRFLPHENIGTMNFGGILLACAEVITSRKRNYSTPPKRDEARVQSLCYANAREWVWRDDRLLFTIKTINDTTIIKHNKMRMP